MKIVGLLFNSKFACLIKTLSGKLHKGDILNGIYIPKRGLDYNVCGTKSICEYCGSVPYGETGKCGMKKSKRRALISHVALNVKDRLDSIGFFAF